jgi:hypothetical protein
MLTYPRRAWALLLLVVLASGALYASLLHSQRVPPPIFPDSVHQLSLARNVLDQQGLATSILHYPEQYQFGTMPAPQTVWPPGLGLASAALAAAGLTPLQALTVITFLAAFLLPVVCFAGTVALSRSATVAFTGALLVLSIPGSWSYTQRLMSEPTFALLTLASLILLTASIARGFRVGLAACAGLLAGMAFLVRYAGVFYIAASGLVLFAAVLMNRSGRSWRALVVYALTSGTPVLALFARNLRLHHQLSGGQFVDSDAAGPLAALVRFVWLCKNVLSQWIGYRAPDRLLSGAVIAVMAALAWMFLAALVRFLRDGSQQTPATIAVLIAIVYAGLTAAVHIVSTALVATWFLAEPRYFIVILPLLFLAATLFASERLSGFWRQAAISNAARNAVIAAVAALLAIHVGLRWNTAVAADSGHSRRHQEVAAVLALPLDDSGQTIGAFLHEHLPPDRAVLSPYPESVYLILERPAVGLIESRFAPVPWNFDSVTALICRLPIDYVLATQPGVIAGVSADQDALGTIIGSHPATYLRALNQREDVRLLAVDREALQAASGPPCRH